MFDHDVAARILEAVVLGMAPERAALAHGITADEHARWIERGSSPDEPTGTKALLSIHSEENQLALYVRALDQAEAQAELTALGKIRDEGTKNPDAYRWFLERRFPEQWAKVPAAARAEQMQAPAPAEPETTEDDGDLLDELKRRRQEKARAAGGNG